ncbi:3-beta-hydroxysteroid-Delta(8),Delta(7)-isomerase [Rhypophila sp. PSN 637]
MGSHHPYHPPSANITNYQANERSILINGAAFALLIAGFVGIGLFLAKRIPSTSSKRQQLGLGEQLGICWFLLCGFLHCFFESYYVLNYKTLAGQQTLFAQLWKEYSLSDSRYLSQDLFVLTIESLTVVTLGPLSLLTAYLLARGNDLAYLSQAVVSAMHLFSVALYYGMCFVSESVSGHGYSRPEFLYFWVYFVGFNAPWVVFPLFLLSQSSREIKRAFTLASKAQSLAMNTGDKKTS